MEHGESFPTEINDVNAGARKRRESPQATQQPSKAVYS
jgi:hypothetical protein